MDSENAPFEIIPQVWDKVDKEGNTEFIRVAQEGKTALLKKLILHYKQKAIHLPPIFGKRNKAGNTALHLAALHGYTGVVEIIIPFLRETGLNTANKEGYDALMLAAMGGHTATLKAFAVQFFPYLKEAFRAKNHFTGHTAITLANVNGHDETVNYLRPFYDLSPGAEIPDPVQDQESIYNTFVSWLPKFGSRPEKPRDQRASSESAGSVQSFELREVTSNFTAGSRNHTM